jgi:hypothetical protein
VTREGSKILDRIEAAAVPAELVALEDVEPEAEEAPEYVAGLLSVSLPITTVAPKLTPGPMPI